MLLVKLDTGFNIEVDFMIPGFFKRFLAWVIDLAILFAYALIGARLLGRMLYVQSQIWVWVLFSLPILFYHLLCEVFLNGQSIGKKATRIKVISADGGEPSLSQYLIRWSFRLAV